MMASLAFLLMFMAFVTLAASMSRHRQQLGVGQLSPSQLRHRRVMGYVLLIISLWPCLMGWKLSVALAIWCGLLTPAALTLGVVLTYWPGVTRQLHVITTLGTGKYGVQQMKPDR